MWELDYKENWVLKNWCFWTVVLEKIFESPLDFKEIQPIHPKGDQSWVFIGRTDAEAETPILGHLMRRADSLEKTLMLLLLSHFSRVQLYATPQMAAHQSPPSLGFSRQDHWSGLPFPSLMHDSEKWKWSCTVVSDSSRPHGLQPTRILHPWDFPSKSIGVGCHCLLWPWCWERLKAGGEGDDSGRDDWMASPTISADEFE